MLTAFRQILVPLLFASATVWPIACLRADEADDQYGRAAGHYDHGRWKLAAEAFQTFAAKHPNDRRVDECTFFRGEALIQLGKFGEAGLQFQSYGQRAPQGKYARAAAFRSAEAAYLAGEFDHAKPELERFLAKYPGDRLDAFVLPYLGDIGLGNDDLEAAASYFHDGLTRFPEGRLVDDCRLGLAKALEKQKKTDEAQRLYSAVANKADSPLAAAAQYHLGALHYNAGRYQQAIAAFSVFDGRFAESAWQPNARLGRGLALLKLGRPAEAIAQFDAVLAAKSAGEELSQQALRGKLQAELDAKDSAVVERRSDEFKRRFPNGPITDDARGASARRLVEGRQYAKAVGELESLIGSRREKSLGPQDLRYRYLLAVSYEGLGRYEEALAAVLPVVDNASPQSGQRADALLAAARLHDKLKQPQQAVIVYQQLAREHPQFSKLDVALYDCAWAMRDLGKADEADRLFQRLRKEYPKSRFRDNATCQLAQRSLKARDSRTAAALIDELLAAKTDGQIREYALYLRGRIAVAQADWPKLREVSETLVREFPQSRRRLFAEFYIAEAFYHQPDYKTAGARFARLAEQTREKREPWMAIVPLRQAEVLAQQNQWNDAFAVAAPIEKEYPRFQQQYEVDYLLGRCLASQADFEAARRAYKKVIRSDTGGKTETAAWAQWRIGETYCRQKDYRSAIREYLSLETLYAYPEWQAAAWLEAAKCHQRLGEATQAAELYRQILKDYPKTAAVKQATELLAAAEKKSP